MNPFEVYSHYIALKSHFSDTSYDFFKYNGKTRVSVDSFETRKDKYQFYKISKQIDPKGYLLANLIDGPKTGWVGDFTQERYEKWEARQKSLKYILENDLEKIGLPLSDKLKVPGPCMKPHLLNMLRSRQIEVETVIILDHHFKFLEKWKRDIADDLVYPDSLHLQLTKYSPFVHYDKVKVKEILKKFLNLP